MFCIFTTFLLISFLPKVILKHRKTLFLTDFINKIVFNYYKYIFIFSHYVELFCFFYYLYNIINNVKNHMCDNILLLYIERADVRSRSDNLPMKRHAHPGSHGRNFLRTIESTLSELSIVMN